MGGEIHGTFSASDGRKVIKSVAKGKRWPNSLNSFEFREFGGPSSYLGERWSNVR